MVWFSSYNEALAYAERNIARSALFAYNVNIDAVKHLKGGEKFSKGIAKLLKSCVRKGEEREVGIDKKMLQFLMKKPGYEETRMGGQAGNMSNVASALGILCYTHVPSKCREQMKLFEHPENVLVADGSFKNPEMVNRRCDVPVHFVMEFGKGYTFQNATAPAPNRLIASFNPPCAVLEIESEFKRLAPRIIDTVSKAVISGFHNPTIGRDFAVRVKNVKEHIEELKGINHHLKVHVELGDFQHPKVLKEVAKEILPVCDSVGFNENELEQLKKVLGMKDNMWKACDRICDRFCTAVFHHARFSFFVDKEEGSPDPVLFGSLLAAHRAASGRDSSFKELEEFAKSIKVSDEGAKKYEEFRKAKFKNNAYFAPALDVGEPKMTVGLGDCFTAGYFLTK
jgi:ADP-dependent phosphofructokinase/glucokinase